MIKTNGSIPMGDGITELKNPDINVYVYSPAKGKPMYGVAQAGKWEVPAEGDPFFKTVQNANVGGESGEWNVGDKPNPSFEDVQAAVLAGLQSKYPNCTFEIIN